LGIGKQKQVKSKRKAIDEKWISIFLASTVSQSNYRNGPHQTASDRIVGVSYNTVSLVSCFK